eukprot:1140558-Pelagomonas_calceolata.AAC.3
MPLTCNMRPSAKRPHELCLAQTSQAQRHAPLTSNMRLSTKRPENSTSPSAPHVFSAVGPSRVGPDWRTAALPAAGAPGGAPQQCPAHTLAANRGRQGVRCRTWSSRMPSVADPNLVDISARSFSSCSTKAELESERAAPITTACMQGAVSYHIAFDCCVTRQAAAWMLSWRVSTLPNSPPPACRELHEIALHLVACRAALHVTGCFMSMACPNQ